MMRKIFLIIISMLLILSLASCREKNQNSVEDNSGGITDSTEQGSGEKNEGEASKEDSNDGNSSDDKTPVDKEDSSDSDKGSDTTVDLPTDEFE